MSQNMPEIWSQSAAQFQQTLNENWSKAFQAFQNMDLGATAAGPVSVPFAPKISFSPEKLQALQL